LCHKTGDSVSIPGRVLGNFHVTYSTCPYSVAQASSQPVTERSTLELPWGYSVAGM
jgi:hypothetical protein